jgi:branched-chain amino acid transport system ATP-binding protein
MERKKMSSNTVLKASDLNKSFSGIVAAKNINVSINQGEIVGIIGANGAGKTVFVNMITGYLKPTSGKIEFLGTDITGNNLEKLHILVYVDLSKLAKFL